MACSDSSEYVEIVQGEDRSIVVNLKDENGDAYDLTGYTAVKVCFKKTDLTALEITATVSSELGGKLTVALTDTQTLTLKADIQPVYVIVDKGSVRRIITKGLERATKVIAKPF